MENKFNFNSQVCTSLSQSERLLALGLRKETADMVYELAETYPYEYELRMVSDYDYLCSGILSTNIPAWSLHRLIEMMPNKVVAPTKGHYYRVQYYNRIAYEYGDYSIARFFGENLYDNIIDCIEWLIKEGYFNKEYLI